MILITGRTQMPHVTSLIKPLVAAIVLLGTPAGAESVPQVIRALKGQGYKVTDVSRTWLGRIRIEAVRENVIREIVMSRSTGEIKQDALFERGAAQSDTTRTSAASNSGGKGKSGGNGNSGSNGNSGGHGNSAGNGNSGGESGGGNSGGGGGGGGGNSGGGRNGGGNGKGR